MFSGYAISHIRGASCDPVQVRTNIDIDWRISLCATDSIAYNPNIIYESIGRVRVQQWASRIILKLNK